MKWILIFYIPYIILLVPFLKNFDLKSRSKHPEVTEKNYTKKNSNNQRLLKKATLEISQNSHENASARASV